MADIAVSDDNSEKSVVDLSNDDRWQARLEEARARREVALREKANDDGSNTPKRKTMPWEEEISNTPVQPLIQSPAPDRVDFADRVDVMRETIKKEDETADLGTNAGIIAMPTSFEDLLTDDARDDAIVDDDLNWTPPPKEPLSAISHDAPDVIELASRYASTLTAVPDFVPLADVEEAVPDEDVAVGAVVSKPQKSHPPALLIVGILALAVLPFTQTAPPLDKGPAMPVPPTLRLQPALGFTTAMLWRPVKTTAQDWTPATDWVMPLSTIFSPHTPDIQLAPAALLAPDMGEPAPAMVEPPVSLAAVRGLQPPALIGAFIDRVPGAFTRRPAPRPKDNAPFVETRAPSRLPDVASGNDASPRMAPIAGTDGSSLEVTRPEAVIFDDLQAAKSGVESKFAKPLSVLQLTILVPRPEALALAQQYAKDAVERGHQLGSIKDVSISISSRNLRYFHAVDRAEAEQLADAYGAEARDFTWFEPKPDRGTVELWLEGKSSEPVAPVRKAIRKTVKKVEPVIRVAPAPQVVIVRKPQGLFSRLFGGHKVGSAAAAGGGGNSAPSTAYAVPSTSTSGDTTDVATNTDTGTDTTGSGGTGTTGTDTTGTDTGTTSDTGTGDTGTTDDTGTGTSDDSGTSSGTDTSSGSGGTSSGSDTSSDDSSSSPGSGSSSGGGSGSSTPSE